MNKTKINKTLFSFFCSYLFIATSCYGTKKPHREISVIDSDEGFYPDRLVVFQNERVRFFITSLSSDKGCFFMPHAGLFMAAVKGEMAIGDVLFTTSGRYKFFCPTTKRSGYITVLGSRMSGRASFGQEEYQKIMKDKKTWVPRLE